MGCGDAGLAVKDTRGEIVAKTERRRGGIPNTLTSSGSGLKQSAFASAFSRSRLCGGGSLFFSRTSLHDLCDESPGAGRGPARPRAKTRRLSRG